MGVSLPSAGSSVCAVLGKGLEAVMVSAPRRRAALGCGQPLRNRKIGRRRNDVQRERARGAEPLARALDGDELIAGFAGASAIARNRAGDLAALDLAEGRRLREVARLTVCIGDCGSAGTTPTVRLCEVAAPS